MKSREFRTKKRHFQYFKRRCEYWANRFGLGHWEFRFQHRNDGGSAAYVYRDGQNWIAKVGFAKKWHDHKPSRVNIDTAALDEIGHCLLHGLTLLGKGRFDWDYVDERAHRTIRRITHALRDEIGK